MLRREAANWLARLQSGRDSDIERKFERWRRADPSHATAFDRVRQSFEKAGLLRHSAVSLDQERARLKPGRQPRSLLAAAAALAVLAPVGIMILRAGVLPFGGTDAVMLMTSVGEIRQVDLADGSKVILDTSTKIDVDVGRSHRRAHLKYGRARFRIAQSNEPFVVEAGGTIVSTRQGVVDVEEVGPQHRVQVLSGAADVRGSRHRDGSATVLGAGQSLTIDSLGEAHVGAALPIPDWTGGMLQFDGTPLPEATALANRYSAHHILLADDVDRLRVSGAFRAGDTGGFAKALAAAFGLSLHQRSDGSLVLSQGGPGVKRKPGQSAELAFPP